MIVREETEMTNPSKPFTICPKCNEIIETDSYNDYMLSTICPVCGIRFNYKTTPPITYTSLKNTKSYN